MKKNNNRSLVKKEKESKISKYLIVFVLAIIIFAAASALAVAAADKVDNDKAVIDFTNTNTTGTVKINLTPGMAKQAYDSANKKVLKKIKIEVKHIKEDRKYNYDLNGRGDVESFPLQWGNGEYSVRVMIQAAEPTKYTVGLATTFTLALPDDKKNTAPFMHANQLVNFTAESKVAKKAAELTKGLTADLDKVEAIYKFVIKELEYDNKKAQTVQVGYVPKVDEIVFDLKMGICFDYAAVFAAMLRSQGIPAKLVMGYVKAPDPKAKDPVYHAWNEFYLKDKGGWFKINEMKFDGKKFERVDTTFDSSSKGSKAAMQFIGDGSNYAKTNEF